MKRIKLLIVLALVFTTLNTFAQNTDAIINDYFTALGGRDKIAQIRSLVIHGTMNVMGNESPSTITILNGKGYKSEMNFGGKSIIQAVTDTGAWMINPMMGSDAATDIPQDQYDAIKDEIFVGGPLLDYKNNGYTVNYMGMDTVDGKSTYKLEATSKGGLKTTFYIDSATHFLDEKSVTLSGQTTSIKYTDYKKTDFGNMMSFSEQITVPQGMQINYTVTKIDINPPVEVSVFNKPTSK